MNLRQLKEHLYDITEKFFPPENNVSIIWTEQLNTELEPPFITLKVNSINRNSFLINKGNGDSYYECTASVDVNVYTRGIPIDTGEDVTSSYENTAMNDLMDFLSFLESEDMTDYMAELGINVSPTLPVQDVTELEDSEYRYRSFVELKVDFAQEASGTYGTKEMELNPNSTGGGFISTELPEIDSIEIENKEENEG